MRRVKKLIGWVVVAALVCGVTGGTIKAAVKDAESASHTYDAAFYQVVNTYDYPGFTVVQFNLPALSHYSRTSLSAGRKHS